VTQRSAAPSRFRTAALGAAAAGAAVTAAALVYLGPVQTGELDAGMLGFLAWAVLPYLALVVAILEVARFGPRGNPVMLIGSVLISAFGGGNALLVALGIDDDAQSVLVFLVLPPLQGAALVLVVVVAAVVGRRPPATRPIQAR
jgi:hypothetical protein